MSGNVMVGLAPAKLNLFLHVTGRRDDGYHSLETAFCMVDRCDRIMLERRNDAVIRRLNDVPGVPAESDLVVRAARLLQARTGCIHGVDIRLDKVLPMGGGLGGGSSDAAAVLLGLNRLWGLGVPRAQLQAWSLALGADVPFFIFGRTAFAAGVGEELVPLDLPPTWHVVVEPPVSVPTVEIFRAEDLTRNSESLIIAGFAAPAVIAEAVAAGRNDLQPVASRLYPPVQAALDALGRFGKSRMSGSGACVFLACASAEHAVRAEQAVGVEWCVWCAPQIDRHPMYDCADD